LLQIAHGFTNVFDQFFKSRRRDKIANNWQEGLSQDRIHCPLSKRFSMMVQ